MPQPLWHGQRQVPHTSSPPPVPADASASSLTYALLTTDTNLVMDIRVSLRANEALRVELAADARRLLVTLPREAGPRLVHVPKDADLHRGFTVDGCRVTFARLDTGGGGYWAPPARVADGCGRDRAGLRLAGLPASATGPAEQSGADAR